ncbi:MAG: ABC transporter ATP-binding protein [Candidatus Hodarchaeota archaeon]
MQEEGLVELLSIKNLKTHYRTEKGILKAVDGVDLKISKGKALGLIGESGCGKTTVAFSILRLIPYLFKKAESGHFRIVEKIISTGKIVDGEIRYKGKNLLELPAKEMRAIRGKEISIILQSSKSRMNPVFGIGYQIGEPKEAHEKIRWEKIRETVFEYLGKVEIADGKKRYRHDPQKFSGGEGQRIMIAMSLICNPYLLLADEPTSSLDVTVQRQVLELMKRMKKEFDLSMLLMTHNLAVVAEMSDHVAVMYAGKIMEYGPVIPIFHNPKHPYTKGLIAATPSLRGRKEDFKFEGITGSPPDPYNPPSGCIFHPRCKYADSLCKEVEPKLVEINSGYSVACSKVYEIPG